MSWEASTLAQLVIHPLTLSRERSDTWAPGNQTNQPLLHFRREKQTIVPIVNLFATALIKFPLHYATLRFYCPRKHATNWCMPCDLVPWGTLQRDGPIPSTRLQPCIMRLNTSTTLYPEDKIVCSLTHPAGNKFQVRFICKKTPTNILYIKLGRNTMHIF